MTRGRLEAFSDGVIAIIITIMVLEMKVPHGSGLIDLAPLLPVFLSYVVSFVYVGIYWNNHHHMLHACTAVTGSILWTNLHLLFWLSLFPFTTGWMGENHFTAVPTAPCGVVLFMAAIAYYLLQQATIRSQGQESILKKKRSDAIGRESITASVHPGYRIHPAFLVDRTGSSCNRGADLADSGPAHRKTSCGVIGAGDGFQGRR
jgi:uncharacterized membrane protein